MVEALGRTMKRDYARACAPDAAAVIRQLPAWFEDYSTVHPHRALSCRSPREFIASRSNRENMSDFEATTLTVFLKSREAGRSICVCPQNIN
jgi:putative transposase